jgi:hypothetical protein
MGRENLLRPIVAFQAVFAVRDKATDIVLESSLMGDLV